MIIPPAPYSYTGEVTTVDVPTLSGTYTYNGESQTSVWAYNNNAISIFGQTSGVNAGSYDVTFSLNSKRAYQWSDGTKADKTGTWSIGKAQNTITFNPDSLSLTYYDRNGTVSVSYLGDGQLSYSINNDNVTATKSENDISVTGAKTGSSIITVNITESNNYLSTSGTFNVAVDMAKNFTVTVNSGDSDMGTVSGGGTVKQGNSITITATPNTDYKFVSWTVDGEVVSTNASYAFTPTDDIDLTANFVELPIYTITATIDPENAGTVTGTGEYREGSTCTLVATAEDGYEFTGWQENGTTVSTDTTYYFEVTADKTFTAVFYENVSRLPAGYTEVEYIHFDGNKTSFELIEDISCNTDRIFMKFYPESFGSTSTPQYLFYIETSPYYIYFYSPAQTYFTYKIGARSSASSNIIYTNTKDTIIQIDIDFNNNIYKLNEQSISGTKSTQKIGNPYRYICSFAGSTSPDAPTGKFYQFTHYRNGEIIHDYVPCINSSGVAGIFDINTETFIENTKNGGTGITAGPAV